MQNSQSIGYCAPVAQRENTKFTDAETDRRTDGQTDRQTDRQTNRQLIILSMMVQIQLPVAQGEKDKKYVYYMFASGD
jgi:hypothetical protein